MRTVVIAFAVLLAAALPASAHRMKLFATVEDGTVAGYAFFIGGGRPEGATLIIRDAAGLELYRGTTGEAGSFSWRPQHPSDLTLLIDAGDGHTAEVTIAADRFAGAEPAPSLAAAIAGPVATSAITASADSSVCSQMLDASGLPSLIDRSVDRAVSRQVRPLLEAYAQADGRVRFNDVVGGIGMIVGLAGMAMWASARRRDRAASTGSDG